MKTTQELEAEFENYLTSLGCSQQKNYHTKFTGNINLDFSNYTDDQSGRKSDDPNDPAANYLPPIPDADGRYYHTIRDITWQTWQHIFPAKTAQQFYAMSDEDRMVCVMQYINGSRYTASELVNITFAYIMWGSGNFASEISAYHSWYGNDVRDDAKTIPYDVFVRLIDIRFYRYSTMRNADIYKLGWQRGIINFWKLFRQYK